MKRTARGDGTIREFAPRPKKFHEMVPVTEKAGTGTIRKVVGYNRTLDEFSLGLREMVEITLLSVADADEETMLTFRRQAERMLAPAEFERYCWYSKVIVELGLAGRVGVSPEVS